MNPDRNSTSGDLSTSVAGDIIRALDADDKGAVRRLVESLHPADTADLLEWVSHRERNRLVDTLREPFDPDILAELGEAVAERVVERLGTAQAAEAVASMATDDAVEVVEALDADVQQAVLGVLPDIRREVIEEGLAWPEDSAGRLMQRNAVTLPGDWNVGKAIDYLREADGLPVDFFDLFLVDRDRRPIGAIPLSRVLRTRRGAALTVRTRSTSLPRVPLLA